MREVFKLKTIKKISIVLTINIILIILIIGLIAIIKNRHIAINEYKGNKKFNIIENNIEDKEYYEFEENNQKYILFKIIEGVYAPGSIKIKSARIIKKAYYNNKLYLDIDIKTEEKQRSIQDGINIDGYNTDYKIFILKVDSRFNGLVINGNEYSMLSDKIVEGNNEKYGYVDETGSLTIPIEYDGLYKIKTTKIFDDVTNDYVDADFSNYLRAKKNNMQGIIDKQGNIIIELQYNQIYTYSKDAFVVTIDNNTKIGIVNTKNKLIKGYIDGALYNTDSFGKYLVYYVPIDGKTTREQKGVLDRNLNIVLEPIYNEFYKFNFSRYNNFGDFNPKYFGGENGNKFSKDFIVVEKDNQTAIMDTDYNFITSFTNLSRNEIIEKFENELLKMLSNFD